jgi:hypothetical protein
MHVVDEPTTGPTRREAQLIVRGRDIIESGDLRRVRETLGMSRPRFAAVLGVSEFTLRTWELYPTRHAIRRRHLARVGKVIGELRRAIDEEHASTS